MAGRSFLFTEWHGGFILTNTQENIFWVQIKVEEETVLLIEVECHLHELQENVAYLLDC